MATVAETVIQIDTIQPISLNIMPACPPSIVSGKNTATITIVVAITDTHTSLVAYIAASRGREPRSI